LVAIGKEARVCNARWATAASHYAWRKNEIGH